MISYIKGEIVNIKQDKIVIENNNIGYNVFVPASLLMSLPGLGRTVKIFTYLNVREDAMNLFGFLSEDDLEVFKLLLTVNGIGPKGALKILGGISPDELRIAVISNDIKTVSSAPGIGKKTAEKLIIELKDKFDIEGSLYASSGKVIGKDESDLKFEAISALSALGYSDSDSFKAVKKAMTPEIMDVETLLKESLKIICSL